MSEEIADDGKRSFFPQRQDALVISKQNGSIHGKFLRQQSIGIQNLFANFFFLFGPFRYF